MNKYEYKGVWIPSCPNHCFERMIDTGIEKHRIAGIEPKITPDGLGYSLFGFRRYSKRLKRHSQTVQGNYYSEQWTHCPHCGSKLLK